MIGRLLGYVVMLRKLHCGSPSLRQIIRQLRVKYWEEKPKDVYVRCRVCSCCGRLRPVHELEAREARAAVAGAAARVACLAERLGAMGLKQ